MYAILIFWVGVIGVLAISDMASKSLISEKIESTSSKGGKARLSTLAWSSQSSLEVTSL